MYDFRLDSDVKDIIFQLASYLYHPSRGHTHAFVVWSDIDDPTSPGWKVAAFLSQLGFTYPVEESRTMENPNTGNSILIWTLPLDPLPFKKWYNSMRKMRIEKQINKAA